MNRYIVEEYYADPALRARLFAKARVERSRSVHAGLDYLKSRARALFSLCIGPLRRTERLI